MRIGTGFALLAAMALEPAGLQPSIPEIERDALIAIYNSTNGEGWFSDANWLGPPGSEASWYGVTVENGHVAILDLSSNYLEGTLPAEIGNLKELRELDLWDGDYLPTWPPFLNNNIGGQVPPEIGQLRELKFLDLSLNAFQDPLPAEIGDLENLRTLLLSSNDLSDLPPEIGNLVHLEILSLRGNDLVELTPVVGDLENLRELLLGSNPLTTLPSSIGNLAGLEVLSANRSSLVDLPESLGRLESLEELDLSRNRLVRLPESIGDLSSLRELDLRWNLLRDLPPSIGRLSTLERLHLQDNLLETLPEEFGALESLLGINVSRNPLRELPPTVGNLRSATYLDISGTSLLVLPPELGNLPALVTLRMVDEDHEYIPAGIGQISQLKSLHLNDNRLTDLPAELAGLQSLEELDISNNKMERLPAVVGELSSLTELNFEGNPLTSGPIPEAFFTLDREILDLSGIGFTGEIPTALAEMTSLRELNLSRNFLTGSIPSELARLPNLEVLNLFGNQLSGSIPPELGQAPKLEVLRLRGNQLSGPIPPELGQAPKLEVLSLSSNQLSGSIPPELGQAPKLESLWLGSNSLTGSIPPELATVSYLSLRSNQLSGPIPAELGAVPDLYLESNRLSGPIPPELGGVRRLCLQDNELAGEIPAALGQVETLNLSRNFLRGSLPAGFCASGNLQAFSAPENYLGGTLEPLADCINLRSLNLSHNQLSGSIPTGFSELPLTRLNLSSNRLTGPVPADIFEPIGGWQKGISLTWNGLYAETPEAQEFLNRFHDTVHAFGFTQTVAPSNLRAEPSSGGEVDLYWDPIDFFFKEGAYEVLYAAEPGGPYRFLARTGSKKDDHIRLSGLETDAHYHFALRTVTEPHEENLNRVYSEPSLEVPALTGSLATLVFPMLFSTPGLSTGLALASNTPQGIIIEAEALGEDGNLWPSGTNPAVLDLGPESQLSFLGEQLLGASPLESNQGWLRLTADNSRLGGLFQIGGTHQLDGGIATAVTARKLYFTRVHDGPGAFRGLPAVTLISLVNPSSEIVGVRLRHVLALVLTGDAIPATEIEIRRAIPPYGMLLTTARQLFERELSDGFIEVRVTRGPGVVGFELIQLPQQRTLIALPAQADVMSQELSAPQAAWGAPFFSNVKLINTTEEQRFVTLSLVTSPRSRPADPVELALAARNSYSADITTLFNLQAGHVGDGSIRMRTSGPGVLGDVVIGGSDSLRFATALPFLDGRFVSQMFAHLVSTPAVFSGLALDNPSGQGADVKLTAFRADGREAGSVDLPLLPWARCSGLVRELFPSLWNQVGGYLRVESTEPVIAFQFIGATDLAFLAAVPPVRGVPPALELK